MGFDFINMTWDFSQDMEVKEARRVAEKYVANAEKFTDKITLLENKVKQLTLFSHAILEMLETQGIVDKKILNAQLEKLIETHETAVSKCQQCGSVKSQASLTYKKCMYCGNPLPDKKGVIEILK